MPLSEILKKIALSVPSIKRVHSERNELQAQRDFLQNEKDALLRERLSLKTDLQAAQKKVVRMKEEGRVRNPAFHSSRDMGSIKKLKSFSVQYAVIGSYGRTATQWVNDALNLHHEVFFTHGHNLHPTKNLPGNREEIFVRMAKEDSLFDFSDVDKFFDIIEKNEGFKVYGQIHGLNPAYMSEHPSDYRRSYQTLAILRHPIQRVNSFMSRLRFEIENYDFRHRIFITEYKQKNGNFLQDISRKYGISGFEDDDLIFIQSVHNTLDYDKMFIDSHIPVFLMERLVNERDYFLKLFLQATNYSVEVNDEYVDALGKLRPVDSQAKHSSISAYDYFEWKIWWKSYFQENIEKHDLLTEYDLLGYDLSFIYNPNIIRRNR